MKTAKKVRTILIVILLVIVLVIVGFHLYGGRAIAVGIEFGAGKALKVPVAVESVNLSILAGKAGVNNLVVDNPPGYQNEKMLELGNAQVDLDLGSVLSDTVKINEILLDNVTMVLEQKGLTNNIQEILNGMSRGPSKEGTDKEADPDKPSKKLLIKKLQISEVAVKVKLLPLPGKADTIELKLKPITRTNLGSDDKVDMAALAAEILLALAGGIAEQGVGILPDDIIGPMGDTVEELAAAAEALLAEGQKQAENLLKGAEEAGEDITKGLGDLLAPKKEDE